MLMEDVVKVAVVVVVAVMKCSKKGGVNDENDEGCSSGGEKVIPPFQSKNWYALNNSRNPLTN